MGTDTIRVPKKDRIKIVRKGLNDKSRKFCVYLHQGHSQIDAYRLAGYTCKTTHIAGVSASRLAAKPAIQAELARLASISAPEAITEENVLRAMASIAFSVAENSQVRRQALNDLAKYLQIRGFSDNDSAPKVNILNVIPGELDRAELYRRFGELERLEKKLIDQSKGADDSAGNGGDSSPDDAPIIDFVGDK